MHLIKHKNVRFCFAAVTALCLFSGVRALAQTKQDDPKKNDEEEPYVLTPFVVEGEEVEGYTATSTLAGTRVRTDLKDTASAISVVTKQFLKDTAVTNNQDLLVYTPSTEVGGTSGNYSGFGGRKSFNESSTLINPSNNNRVRGLDSADNTRDYFLTDIPWDSFNTGRIDLQRGPNSILFGVGSPAGIINASINDAAYRRSNLVEFTTDQWGTLRASGDFNQVLIKNTLAARFSVLEDRHRYEQKEAFNDQKRFYGAIRYDADLFGQGNHTTVRAKYENGAVRSNNPRMLPPYDSITPWFQGPYNKVIWDENVPGQGYLSTSSSAYGLLRPGGVASLQGATSGPDVKYYYTGGSSTPAMVMAGNLNTGRPDLIQALRPMQMPTYSQYAAARLPGGSFYTDKVLTDPTVFNFFEHLLDGPNKREWQNWDAYNVDVQQTLFKDRLAFDLTYDSQSYDSGQNSIMSGGYYTIGVDINKTLPDQSANPYAGRPYVAGNNVGNYSYKIDRESVRGIVTGDVKAEDLLGKNWLSRILGRHVLTGLAAQDERRFQSVVWSQNATTADLINMYGLSTSSLSSIAGTRQFDWIYYLGNDLSGKTSAAGASLNPISVTLSPGSTGIVRYFNGTWNAAASVDKTAPYTYTDLNTNAPVTGTQSQNPANYVGWSNGPVKWLDANNPADFPSLVIGGNRQKFKDLSRGFTWQGYLFDGVLVPTFGWRKDKVINYDTNAQPNPNSGIAPLEYALSEAGRRETNGQSRNWSGVLHVPPKLTSKLWGMKVSLLYNESSNFKADAPRRNLTGNIIPNPQGNTREKGIVVSLLDDKLILKANWFNTMNQNATLASGASAILGNQSYELYQLTALGYVIAAMTQDSMNGVPDGVGGGFLNDWASWTNYAYADGVAGVSKFDTLVNTSASSAYQTATQTINQKKAVAAWLNMPAFMNKDFYKFWNVGASGIDPAKAKASGNLGDAIGTRGAFNQLLYLISIISPTASTLPVSTVDTRSKGQEYEMTFVPVKNWNITVNYTKTFATRTNLDASTITYMNEMNKFMTGDAGYIRLWAIPSYQLSTLWTKDLWLPYQVTLSSQGQSAPEVAPWRLNLVSTYTFNEGRFKGFKVGGAARLEAAKISGYYYSSTLGYLDVKKPRMGPQDSHFDMWVGYSKKLKFKDMVWRTQINIRNVGEKTRLVPAYYQPDGTLSLARIQDGMSWRFSNSLEF